MTQGFLVNPDLTFRRIDFEVMEAQKYFGELTNDHVSVSFHEDGTRIAALYSAIACKDGAEPNPVASMARTQAILGDSRFLIDPVHAICGTVIFVGAEGEDLQDEELEIIQNAIRACKNYREDFEEDYAYWRNAVLNLHRN